MAMKHRPALLFIALAVINIKSNYRNNELVSDTEYQCGAGALFAGVALKGRIVKLAK
jgi:hypothetical protein